MVMAATIELAMATADPADAGAFQANLTADTKQLQTLDADSLGPAGSDGDTYPKMVRHNTATIVSNLSGARDSARRATELRLFRCGDGPCWCMRQCPAARFLC
jgi:ABC-type Zn uptake system ZnuABC Zn-binding protein ZnuA